MRQNRKEQIVKIALAWFGGSVIASAFTVGALIAYPDTAAQLNHALSHKPAFSETAQRACTLANSVEDSPVSMSDALRAVTDSRKAMKLLATDPKAPYQVVGWAATNVDEPNAWAATMNYCN